MDSYDLIYDWDRLYELTKNLSDATDCMWDNCDNLFNEIDSISDSWSGDAYENFESGVRQYEPAIRAIPSILVAFGTAIADARVDGIRLSNKIKADLDNLMEDIENQ